MWTHNTGMTSEEWRPGLCRRKNFRECDELDRRVAGLDWSDAARAWGSAERRRVAQWMIQSRIVDDVMRQLYPQQDKREVMTKWVTVRVWEKIVGASIESNPNLWNWDNLWNPLEPTSFCGWVRGLARSLAQWNGKRVLRSRVLSEADMRKVDDEGKPYDAIGERADVHPLIRSGRYAADAFARHPDLLVYRPVGDLRERMTRMLAERGVDGVTAWAREAGVWHASMDDLPADQAATLMLQPLTRNQARLVSGMRAPLDLADGLADTYWPTQLATPQVTERRLRALRDMVRATAKENGVSCHHVWCVLGSMAARALNA